MENKKIVRILVVVVAVLGIVYVLGILYEGIRPKYNMAVERSESLIASAEASVEASIAAEEQKREENLQEILASLADKNAEESNADNTDESADDGAENSTVEGVEADAEQTEEQSPDETAQEAGDVIMPQSVVEAAHDFAYEISTNNIPDTYQDGDTTYTLSSYNLYGYSNGRDRWEALFQEKNIVYSFTGYIDTKLNVTPKVEVLAEEVGLDCTFYVLAEQEFDANGQVIKQYHYRLNDEMQKGAVLYGYEYDYNNKGQKTEYRYYYNSRRSEGSEGLQLSQRTIYEYGEDGICNAYQEYKGDGTLKKTHIYNRDSSGRRSEKITSNAKGTPTDFEQIYYDDLGAICKTVTSKKVLLYINDDEGNHIVKAVYETE